MVSETHTVRVDTLYRELLPAERKMSPWYSHATSYFKSFAIIIFHVFYGIRIML